MVVNINNYQNLKFQKSRIFEECCAFNYDFFVVGSKEYYNESFYNDTPDKTIARKVVFKPNFISDDDIMTNDKPALDSVIIGDDYYNTNTQPYLAFNKSVISQFLYLNSVLKGYRVRLVIPSASVNKLHISADLYYPLIAYGCEVLIDEKAQKDFIWQNDYEKTSATGVYFEVENHEGKYVFCGYNSIVFDGEEPIANNFLNSMDTICSVKNNFDKKIRASVIYNDFIEEFCNDNSNREKIVDALSAIIHIYNKTNFVTNEQKKYLNKYASLVENICNEENLKIADLKKVISSIMYSLGVKKKDIMHRIMILFNTKEEIINPNIRIIPIEGKSKKR